MADPVTIALALGKIVPEIVGWVKGPKAQETAEKVVSVAMEVSGHKALPEAAAETIAGNPEMVAAFKTRMREIEVEVLRLELADVANARAMQVAALAQADVFSKRFAYYYAIGWALFSMVYFSAVTFWPVPTSGVRVADTVLGVLIGTVITGIFGWLYGSTRRSADKDATIQALTRGGR